MLPKMISDKSEVVGTLGNDVFNAATHQIIYGLQGDDHFAALPGSYNVALIGGPGNDTYVTARESLIIIVDSGGYDTIQALGMDLFSPCTYAMVLEGKHFAAVDIKSLEAVIIANAFAPDTRIEEVHLASGVYSFSTIETILPFAENYLGNISIRTAADYGVFAPGITNRDVEEALQYVAEREQALIHAAHEPPPVAGDDQPVSPGASESHVPVNAEFYYAHYPDVQAAGIDAAEHFMNFGWKEGRDPSPLFDTSWYLENYLDVAQAGLNPLLHYWNFGAAEGRNPNALFDTRWYLEQNPDVAAAGVNPLHHYETQGWREGRNPSAEFDGTAYLAAYPDVAQAGIDPLVHYLHWGMIEGRAI